MTRVAITTVQTGTFQIQYNGQILTGGVEKDPRSPDVNLIHDPDTPIGIEKMKAWAKNINFSHHVKVIKIHVLNINGIWRITIEAHNGTDALGYIKEKLQGVIEISMKN